METTINNSPQSILTDLYEEKADVYIFSCYIWNIKLVYEICSDLRSIFKNIKIGLAGPQVSYHQKEILEDNHCIDFILFGEGEESTPKALRLIENDEQFGDLKGICYRHNGEIILNMMPDVTQMDSLPFAYENLECLKNRILYYESMRGCPFSCSYCLSGDDKRIRTRSLPLVFEDLQIFLDSNVKQVKFVDRTFNAIKQHALLIWEYLILNDNKVTNFHFEMSGELMDEDMLNLLQKARKGLFQFEIGVQSLNKDTLKAIDRQSDFKKLAKTVQRLKISENIHLHLDLIAGLPYEGFLSFSTSFNGVYCLFPDQIQIGFLKVLPGSKIERETDNYGVSYSSYPPFEVLCTNYISYDELCIIRGVSQMTEMYYNSGRFQRMLKYMLEHFDTPFDMYKALWNTYQKHGYTKASPSHVGYYEILKKFMDENNIIVTDRVKWLCKLDFLGSEKPRKLPDWVDVDLAKEHESQIIRFLKDKEKLTLFLPLYCDYEVKQLKRIIHIEVLPFSPVTGEDILTVAIFDYQAKITHFVDLQKIMS